MTIILQIGAFEINQRPEHTFPSGMLSGKNNQQTRGDPEGKPL
jgi:hypothetical protein